MHLLDVYRTDLGLSASRDFQPCLVPHFFPSPINEYVTIHTDDNIPSKHYPFWDQVIHLVKLARPSTKFLQIGSGSEPNINSADARVDTSNLKQCAYLISRAEAHLGIDSSPCHIANALKTPSLSLYGNTYKDTCIPVFNDGYSFGIENHSGKPCFSLEDPNNSIKSILPEEIASKLLRIISGPPCQAKTIFLGENCNVECHDVDPNEKCGFQVNNMNFRLDWIDSEPQRHHWENLVHLSRNSPVEVTTRHPIPDSLLSNKRISYVNYKTDEFDHAFVEKLNRAQINNSLLGTDPEKLPKQRIDLFDHTILDFSDLKLIENGRKLLGDTAIPTGVQIFSRKQVLSGERAYESYYDFMGRENFDHLLLDISWMWLYTPS